MAIDCRVLRLVGSVCAALLLLAVAVGLLLAYNLGWPYAEHCSDALGQYDCHVPGDHLASHVGDLSASVLPLEFWVWSGPFWWYVLAYLARR